MFKVWFRFHSFQPTDETSIRQEALWGNKYISNSKGPLQNLSWARKGIRVVQDLCHDTQDRLLSHTELQEKYGVTATFLDALAIRHSIPIHWRQALSRDWVPPPLFPGGPLLLFPEQPPQDLMKLSSKKTYSLILSTKTSENPAFHRWKDKVRDQDEWTRVCRRPYITTQETKLQSLQFKILHAITPCKKYLRQIRILDDEHCPHCGEIDDLNHFFFLCPLVQSFWNIHLEHITSKEAVLGLDDHSTKGKIANFILLHFRFFIHRQRLFHDNKFDLLHWLSELRLRIRCMKTNLQYQNKIGQARIWTPLLQALG